MPGNSFESAIHDYYVFIDGEIRQLLELVDDGAVVLVISDHGAKPILGGICINDWLIENGYLVLKEQPSQPTSLAAEHVDWSRTRAWGEGGYYARISMNVAGREPEGIVPQEQYETERERLAHMLEEIHGPDGERIGATHCLQARADLR